MKHVGTTWKQFAMVAALAVTVLPLCASISIAHQVASECVTNRRTTAVCPSGASDRFGYAAIGHLGEGTGQFAADPSWRNVGGAASDVLTAGTVISAAVSVMPSVTGSRTAAAAKKTPVNELLSSGGKFVVDSKGNTIHLKPGETFTSSPDGKWIQARGPDGKPTGLRLDGPHNRSTHKDPRALQTHGHVPGVTNPDGTPWLSVNK